MAGAVTEETEGASSFQQWGDEGDVITLLSVDICWREDTEKGRDAEISFPIQLHLTFLGEHLYLGDCFYSRFLIPWVAEQKFYCTGIRQRRWTHNFFFLHHYNCLMFILILRHHSSFLLSTLTYPFLERKLIPICIQGDSLLTWLQCFQGSFWVCAVLQLGLASDRHPYGRNLYCLRGLNTEVL